MTQQNAAMVEQSTAASHSLAGEAEELSRLIGRFDLGDAADAPAPSATNVRKLSAVRAKAAPAPKRSGSATRGTAPMRGNTALARNPDADTEEGWEEF